MALEEPDTLMRIADLHSKSLMDVATLGPDEMAQSPVQYASLGDLFKLGAKFYGGNRAKPAVPSDAGVGKPAIDARPRVASEGNLTPDDLGYRQTQDAAASDVLSPEGQAKFKDQRGPTDLTPEGQLRAQALDDLDDGADLTPDQQLDQVVGTAQRGQLNEQQGFRLTDESTGLADEGQAVEVLTDAAKGDQYLKSIADGAPFNWNNIRETDDVKLLMQAVSDSLADPQQAATRGIISNKETLENAQSQLVDSLGVTKRTLKRKIGTTFANAADATAARIVLADSAKKLADLAKKVATGQGGDQTMLVFRRQLAIHNGIQLQIKGAQTEAARLLQSFNIPVTGDMDAVEAAALRMDIIDAAGGARALRNAAEGLLNAGKQSEGQFNQVAQQSVMSRFKDGMEHLYINGLLSNPRSNLKNILGNALFMGYQVPEEILAGLYGTGERAIRKAIGSDIDYTNQVYMGDALARMSGWFYSFGDSWAAAGEGFRRGIPGDSVNKIDVNRYENFGNPDNVFGRAMTQLYRSTSIPTRFLLAGDEFFKVMSQNGEMGVQAHRQMKAAYAAGMSRQDAVDEGMMVMLSPRTYQAKVDYKSRHDTLMSDLGEFGKAAGMLQNTLFGRFIMPFVTAPTNDILRTIERTPWLAAFNPYTYRDVFGKDAVKRQNTLGRLSLAGVSMAFITHYAMAGQITGARPQDPRQREKLPPGWQPYSFVFRGEGFPVDDDGDPLPLYDNFGNPNGPLTYVNYSGLGPAASMIGITVNALQFNSMARNAEDRQSIASAAVFAATDYFKELPFLQGVSDTFLALQRQDASYLVSGPLGSMNLVPGVPNPFSSLMRAGDAAIDSRRKKINVDFDIYTEQDVIDLTDQGVLPQSIEGGYDFRYVGLAKGDAGDQFFQTVHQGFNQMIQTNVFADSPDANVPMYDTLGQVLTKGPSLAENPVLAAYNAVSPFMISSSDEQPEYVKELVRIDWPIPQMPKTYKGIDLTVEQQSLMTWLAKGRAEDAPELFKQMGITEPLTVKIDNRRNDFIGAIERRMGTRQYRKADRRRKQALIRDVHQQFLEAAWNELTALPGFERLGQAALEIESLMEGGYR